MNSTISDEMIRLQILNTILTDNIVDIAKQRDHVGIKAMDDAALVKISDSESLVIASDFIRGSGFYLFELGYLNYYDIGYYLIAANVSDIAAMGAKPFGLTTIIRYTKKMTDNEFQEIFKGMKAAADKHNSLIIGGDIGGYNCDVFAATAFGFIKTENALLRKNAQKGDLLCVTGKLGLPITALTYFKEVKQLGFSFTPEQETELLLSWKRPSARVTEGIILSENKLANACQDISDGLKATIEQMSAFSENTFTLFAEKIPMHQMTRDMASFLGVDPVQIAISASVDFELMFTLPPSKLNLCADLFKKAGTSFTVVGEVNNSGKNLFITIGGLETDLPGVAWKQQTNDYLKDIIQKGK